MGKIRVTTIGDDAAEKEQKVEAKKRSEEKKKQRAQDAEVKLEVSAEDPEAKGRKSPSSSDSADKRHPRENDDQILNQVQDDNVKTEEATPAKKQKKDKFLTKKASPHSSKYNAIAPLIDQKKVYSLKEALEILPKLKTASFDETVELHINTVETGLGGNVVLPHGTGKKTRVTIVDAAKDPKGIDELIKNIEAGKIDFDVLVATPDSMSRLAKVARYLGPKGLMPNPKSGTVTTKPEEVAKKYEGGQVNFKTEAKFPIMHLAVGKLSFGEEKLSENIKTMLKAVEIAKMKSVTLKSTMSPGIKIDFSII